MSKSQIPHTDSLEKLRMEKAKLRTFCKGQEKLIGLKVEFLKENYPKILTDSMLPFQQEQNQKINHLLDGVNGFITRLFPGIFENRIFPNLLLRMTEISIIRAFTEQKKRG